MVEHCIGRSRQTVRYIAAYYEAWGETFAFRNAAASAAAAFLVWRSAKDMAATAGMVGALPLLPRRFSTARLG